MSVASENRFGLLLADENEDARAVPLQTKEVVRNTTSSKKREEKPAREGAPKNARGESKHRAGGNEGAFRDRDAGADRNREKPTDEGQTARPRGRGRGTGRGGEASRNRVYDRHSQTGRTDTEKQITQGWGMNTGELADETAATAIADEERQEALNEPTAPATPAAEEDNSKTLEEYLAERAEKLAGLGGVPEARRANEGHEGKFSGQALQRNEEAAYFGGSRKEAAHKQRARKEKQLLEIEQVHPPRPRGGRGRGDRGDRGDRGGRAGRRGRGRGDYRGTSYGGGVSSSDNSSQQINPNDFPSL